MTSKGIAILGSTGSIGCNTLRVVESLGEQFRVVALGAGGNVEKLAEQIERHEPRVVSVKAEGYAQELVELLRARGAKAPAIRVGEAGLIEVATAAGVEIVVSAIVGAIGLVPTLAALKEGKRVALANKETLVMAGELVTQAARETGAELLPIDSEHNAIHQCLRGEKRAEVRRLVLTASGGPFRCKTPREMEEATVEDAMRHPTWTMGAKITVDSATLMNKGLEVIEAHWLFGFEGEEIDVLVHPESVVHSMIELVDGSIIAQMGMTDMRHAIQYALTYPERQPSMIPPLDLARLSVLNFEAPDRKRFPCLDLAYRALRVGGTLPACLNAANEVAVEAFLENHIRLTDIPLVVDHVMREHEVQSANCDLGVILQADREARASARSEIERLEVAEPTRV